MDKLERARQLGVLKDGWRYQDYCLACGPSFGWLCSVVWGEKGSGKSNSMLQHGYAMFHAPDRFEVVGTNEDGSPIQRGIIEDWSDMEAWEKVLKYTVFRPRDFASLLNTVLKERQRLSWCAWDDINIHFPRSMYSTNRKLWEQFSKNWEGFRANLSVFECTAPRKDKVVSFILSDLNWDCLVSARHKVELTRWFWDKDFYEPEKVNKFRIDVDAEELVLEHVPKEVWDRYWQRKIELTDESTEGFQTMLEDMDKPEGETTKPVPQFICPRCGRDLGNAYNLKVHKCKNFDALRAD